MNTDMLRRRAQLIAVQTAAMMRNGSTFFVSCFFTECSAILLAALKIWVDINTCVGNVSKTSEVRSLERGEYVP